MPRVSPLNHKMRMVNEQGQPTPEFMRWWQEFLATVNPLSTSEGVSNLVDVLGDTRGSLLVRSATEWVLLTPDTAGYVLVDQGPASDPIWQAPTFLALDDSPASYTGQSEKVVRVNTGETGLEFYTLPTAVTTFLGLTDTPSSFTGQAGKFVAVNGGETALEFVTGGGGGGGGGVTGEFSGASISRQANHTGQNFTGATLYAGWDTTEFDEGGWSDVGGSNPSRLTVPSGVTRVRVSASFSFSNVSSGITVLQIWKNGAAISANRISRDDFLSNNSSSRNLDLGVVEVTAGDYFECRSSINLRYLRRLGWRRMHLPDRRSERWYTGLLRRQRDPASGAYRPELHRLPRCTPGWDTAEYDEGGWSDIGGSNPSRLTVPTGVTRVRIQTNIALSNFSSGILVLQIWKNGAVTPQGFIMRGEPLSNNTVTVALNTGVLEVSPGDYFECRLVSTVDSSVDVSAGNMSFSIESVPG